MSAAADDAAERRASQSSVGELVSEVSQDFSLLVRQEVALAKAELRQEASKAGRGAGMFAGAVQGAYFVLLFLSLAFWWALGTAIGLGWSALVVAGVWLVIAVVLALAGRSQLRAMRGTPQTVETVKKVPAAMTGHEEDA